MKILKIVFIFLLTITHSYSWSLFGKSNLENCADLKIKTWFKQFSPYKYHPFDDQKMIEFYNLYTIEEPYISDGIPMIYGFKCEKPESSITLCGMETFIELYPDKEEWAKKMMDEYKKEQELKICSPTNPSESCSKNHNHIAGEWDKIIKKYSYFEKFTDKSIKYKLVEENKYEDFYKTCEKDKSEFPITFNEKYN